MFLNSLYNLFITPLELVFEFVFSVSYRIFANPGVSILFLSLVMNFLVLPLYKRADAIQEEEKNKAQRLKKWVDHIKANFKGDDRYMILNEYYRIEGYHPIMSLRSSFSLLLQIPFFIAAYHYLSNLSILNGMSFLFLKDLGAPDGLLVIGNISVNTMPIIMTVINVLAAYVYLKGFPIKDKIQTYAIAAIFLVLLYDSPSGLVFYWTLNQVFSLCKNLTMKFAKKMRKKERDIREVKQLPMKTYILGAVLLTLIIGLVIPMSVIVSSPSEFVAANATPATILVNNICVSVGFFIIWFGIFYYLAKPVGKNVITYVMWLFSIGTIVNFIFFGRKTGTMSTYLIFDEDLFFESSELIVNLIIVVVLAVVLVFFMKYLYKIVPYIYAAIIMATVVLCVINIIQIRDGVKDSAEIEQYQIDEKEKIIPLSKNGKNVIVLMMDRAISGFVPYMFQEKEQLVEQFDGFIYYPNTLAYGGHTNFAVPAVYGGYEYTPYNINKRSSENLVDKHNEALLVLPTVFASEDYEVTVIDPPYVDYKWNSDTSIFEGKENITAYLTKGVYSGDFNAQYGETYAKIQNRNFIMYSIMRSLPLYLQGPIYDNGNYFSTGASISINEDFIESYSTLCELSNITDIRDDDEDTFLIMDNETAHAVTLLNTPDYTPGITNSIRNYNDKSYVINGVEMKMDSDWKIKHYHVNMAAFLKLGEWFEYLKEQGVYDNTRIIIVSDHGYGAGNFENMKISDDIDVEWYNSLLLVKDFNCSGEMITCDDFMTSADTPTLATEGIMEDVFNPYTGNLIDSSSKFLDEQLMTTSHLYSIYTNAGKVFDTSDGKWYWVKENIFDIANWTEVETGSAK